MEEAGSYSADPSPSHFEVKMSLSANFDFFSQLLLLVPVLSEVGHSGFVFIHAGGFLDLPQ